MKSVKGEWLECWANGKCQSPGCFQYKLMIGFANRWERKLVAGDLQKLNADCTLKDKMNQWIY